MNYQKYFPKGIAHGDAFCNRIKEQQALYNNINADQHTLIISPRRYGKTSLVRKKLLDAKWVYGEADLFVAIDAERIQHILLEGIKEIIQKICSSLDQAISLLLELFKNANSKWIIGGHGIKLEMIPQKNEPAIAIKEALQALEKLLAKKKVRAVLFIDEMQEIGEVAEGKGIEGAIRHVAQSTQHLSLIFSGSKRHLLHKMFYDKSRPLYKLCDRITLERIPAAEYKIHLNKIAKKSWRRSLTEEVITAILQHTECHPYYMNMLSLKVWQLAGNTLPTINLVNQGWREILEEYQGEVIQELSNLSQGQRKILVAIARGQHSEFMGKEFLIKNEMSSSGVAQNLQSLEQKDYLIKTIKSGEYQILDPVMRDTLRYHFGDGA